jgi:hypothetical protein
MADDGVEIAGLGTGPALVGTELFPGDNGSSNYVWTPNHILAYIKGALTGGNDLGALALLNLADNAHLANMATSTIKGRKSTGSGAPEDLSAADLATILNSVGGVLKSKVIGTTRDLTTASGNQAITGVGFQPTCVIMLAMLSSSYASVGFADSGKVARCVNTAAAGSGWDWSTSLGLIFSSSGNYQRGAVNSYDSDGFTIAWTKTGSPTGTAQLFFLCLR